MLTGAGPRRSATNGRRRWSRAAVTLLALILTATVAGPAVAATGVAGPRGLQAVALGGGGECPPGQTNCDVWGGEPGDPGGGGDTGGDTGGGSSGGDGPRKCTWNGKPVRCYDNLLGWFNNADGCYYKLAEPQPDGTPEGKDWYVRTCNGGHSSQESVLLDAPPGGFGAPPDPAELAAEALASLTLARPEIGIAPNPAKGPGLVGLPIWLWVSNTGQGWDAQEASRTDRNVTVEITAQVEKAVWTMGNGARVTCDKAGVKHRGQRGESPQCGYGGYPRSSGDGKYKVAVTTYWTVPWSSSTGESGVLTTTRISRPVWIEIDELQVVTR